MPRGVEQEKTFEKYVDLREINQVDATGPEPPSGFVRYRESAAKRFLRPRLRYRPIAYDQVKNPSFFAPALLLRVQRPARSP